MNVEVSVNITNKNPTADTLDEGKISMMSVPELKI